MGQDERPDGLQSEDPRRPTPKRPAAPGVGTQTRRRVGIQLRAMYDRIVQEPVPDRFKDLIDQLGDPPETSR